MDSFCWHSRLPKICQTITKDPVCKICQDICSVPEEVVKLNDSSCLVLEVFVNVGVFAVASNVTSTETEYIINIFIQSERLFYSEYLEGER